MDAAACDLLIIEAAGSRPWADYAFLVETAGRLGHGENDVQRSLTRLVDRGVLSHRSLDGLTIYTAVRK